MAHRKLSPKSFMRKTSPALLDRYFASRGVTLTLDPSRPEHDKRYYAWAALPARQRDEVLEPLKDVHDLSADKARPYLMSRAEAVWAGDAGKMDAARNMSGQDLALTLFLDAPVQFQWAVFWFNLDSSARLKDYEGKYETNPNATPERKERLRQAMASFFHNRGQGENCVVEDYQSGDRLALVVYHEDYPKAVNEFEAGHLVPRVMRIVVKVAAVFHEGRVLSVKGSRAIRERLRDAFAEIFVGDTSYFKDERNTIRYNFGPLLDPDFDFPTDPRDHISTVSLVGLTVQIRTSKGQVPLSLPAVDGVLDEVLAKLGLDRRDLDVTDAKIRFRFPGKGRSGWRTACIGLPNESNLGDTERDQTIRRYLRLWEIERGEQDHREPARGPGTATDRVVRAG